MHQRLVAWQWHLQLFRLDGHAHRRLPARYSPCRILQAWVQYFQDAVHRMPQETQVYDRTTAPLAHHGTHHSHHRPVTSCPCLLYTSDAADEEDSVDLGGR